jgi:hypothetical protein
MSIADKAQPARSGPPSVFISGSISVRRLPFAVSERLGRIIDRKLPVVLGDAPGADAAVQRLLADQRAADVTIFCSGAASRNNLGRWPVRTVHADASPGTRGWHMAKDSEMARLADTGLVIWDGSSPGSFANIERLSGRGCYILVYLAMEERFLSLRSDAGRTAFLTFRRPA